MTARKVRLPALTVAEAEALRAELLELSDVDRALPPLVRRALDKVLDALEAAPPAPAVKRAPPPPPPVFTPRIRDHCSACGAEDFDAADGYTGCCNEPVCSGSGVCGWAWGREGGPALGTVQACCPPTLTAPPGAEVLWRAL